MNTSLTPPLPPTNATSKSIDGPPLRLRGLSLGGASILSGGPPFFGGPQSKERRSAQGATSNPAGDRSKLGNALKHLEPKPPSASLADIILGGQDGLVNTLGVLLGVAAASSDPRIVMAGGLAAMFAESISMGAVAYTATLADRDHYLAEVERERREIREMPHAEEQEIREVFQNWGFRDELLEQSVAQVMKNEEAWVDVMMRNELKLAPIEPTSAFRAALVVGISALVGSFIPLVPFLFLPIGPAIAVSLLISALTLFAVGAYKAKITVGRPWKSGLQMAVIGIVSALAGYVIGALFGAPAGG